MRRAILQRCAPVACARTTFAILLSVRRTAPPPPHCAAPRPRCQISKNPDIRRRVSDGAQNLQTWKTALRVGRLLDCTGYGCALYGSRSRDYYAAQNFFYGQKMHFRRRCTVVVRGWKKFTPEILVSRILVDLFC